MFRTWIAAGLTFAFSSAVVVAAGAPGTSGMPAQGSSSDLRTGPAGEAPGVREHGIPLDRTDSNARGEAPAKSAPREAEESRSATGRLSGGTGSTGSDGAGGATSGNVKREADDQRVVK